MDIPTEIPIEETLIETGEVDIEFCGRTDQVQFAIQYQDPNGEHHVPGPEPITLDVDELPLETLYDYVAFYEWEAEK